MTKVVIGDLIQANDKRWAAMTIHPNRIAEADGVAKTLLSGKERFQTVATLTHVPWDFIAIASYREYGLLKGQLRWDRSLAQGDPIFHTSIHVPKGRPAGTWEEVAYDALVNCAPYASKWKDWSIGGMLTLWEEYNGLGYAMRGLASPYIFAGSDQYNKGKYDADGHYDPFLTDPQLGCAVLLSRLYLMDKSIAVAPTVKAPNASNPSTVPSSTSGS